MCYGTWVKPESLFLIKFAETCEHANEEAIHLTKEVSLVSDLPAHQVQKLGFTPVSDPDAFGAGLTGKGYVIPFGENILPRVSV